MSKVKTICAGCKFAEWQKTSNGRINPHQHGKCKKVVQLPAVPFWAEYDANALRSTLEGLTNIWYMGVVDMDCATFEPKG